MANDLAWVTGILSHTPWWVFVLFAYLVSRGLRARKPGEVTLLKMAIMPVLFTVWGIVDLARLQGINAVNTGLWLGGLAAGAVVGRLLLRGVVLRPDRARGAIQCPADYTVLPLILLVFGVKYVFGVMTAISPRLLQEPVFRIAEIGFSGLFAGIFLGKFFKYAAVYFAAPQPLSGIGSKG